MDISATTLFFSFLSGILTTLSPCVLPILPIIVSSALSRSKFGLITLALGMALSFSLIGTLLSSVGLALGLDSSTIRTVGGILLLLVGIWLISPKMQELISSKASGFSNQAQGFLAKFNPDSAKGQFIVGVMLGAVWSPCVGPTLGAAIALASRAESLLNVFIVMTVFGISAVIPLIAIGLASRQSFKNKREKIANFASKSKIIMGICLIVISLMVLTGLDKVVEGFLVEISPEWLTDLTTRF